MLIIWFCLSYIFVWLAKPMHGSKEGLGVADIIHQNRKTQEELDLDIFFV